MSRVITIVLSAILVTTPTKPVLAQDAQRESKVDSTRTRIPTHIGVPVVEPGSGAALLFAAGMRDHTPDRDALPPPSRRVSTALKVVRTGAGLFMGLVQAVGIIAENFPRSTFSVVPSLDWYGCSGGR